MSDPVHYSQYIDGQWIDSAQRFDIVDPATGRVFATAARGTVADADRAVAAAKAAHGRGEWRSASPAHRADVLAAIAADMAGRIDELVALHVHENGVTVRQATAFHVGYAIAHLQYFADLARTYVYEHCGPRLQIPTAAAGIVRREPIGVVAGIVPWNFPLLLAVWKLGPALAAGNTIVLKPDEKTPLTLLELARSAERAGLPAGVLNIVTGSGEEVGARLASHPDVRKIAFTGSTAVGREISRLAADNVKRVTLELGGKGPNIILDDADIETAVDGALFACLLYAGQACESGTRLLLPETLHDDFVDRLVARVATIKVGHPSEPDTDIGPVISSEQRDRILDYIDDAQKEGATLAFGGEPLSGPTFEQGNWVGPTILTDVTRDMTIAREEVFGPVLSVIKYRTVEEAIEIANDTEYGLSAGVWSEDVDRALAVAGQIEAGTVWINDWHMVSAQYPFGGYKQSGLGRELGPGALDEYTEEKFIHVDLSRDLARRAYGLLLPPAAGQVAE